jgi:hypothetical protein
MEMMKDCQSAVTAFYICQNRAIPCKSGQEGVNMLSLSGKTGFLVDRNKQLSQFQR